MDDNRTGESEKDGKNLLGSAVKEESIKKKEKIYFYLLLLILCLSTLALAEYWARKSDTSLFEIAQDKYGAIISKKEPSSGNGEEARNQIQERDEYGFKVVPLGQPIILIGRDVSGTMPKQSKQAVDAVIGNIQRAYNGSIGWALELWDFGTRARRIGGPAFTEVQRNLLLEDWSDPARVTRGKVISMRDYVNGKIVDNQQHHQVDDKGRLHYRFPRRTFQPADDQYTDILAVANAMVRNAITYVKEGYTVQLNIMTDMVDDPPPQNLRESDGYLIGMVSARLDSIKRAHKEGQLLVNYFMARSVPLDSLAFAESLFSGYPNFTMFSMDNWGAISGKMKELQESLVGAYSFAEKPENLAYKNADNFVVADIPVGIRGLDKANFRANFHLAGKTGAQMPFMLKQVLDRDKTSLYNKGLYTIQSKQKVSFVFERIPNVPLDDGAYNFEFALEADGNPIGLLNEGASFTFTYTQVSFISQYWWIIYPAILFFIVLALGALFWWWLGRIGRKNQEKRAQAEHEAAAIEDELNNTLTGHVQCPDGATVSFKNAAAYQTKNVNDVLQFVKTDGMVKVQAMVDGFEMRYRPTGLHPEKRQLTPNERVSLPIKVRQVQFVLGRANDLDENALPQDIFGGAESDINSVLLPERDADETEGEATDFEDVAVAEIQETSVEQIYTYYYR